jgi:hypothetical protein
MWEATAWLVQSEYGETHNCHNTWKKERWFTGLLCEGGCNGHLKKRNLTILLLFDWKKFDGKLDQIEGIFQSLGRYFPPNLEFIKAELKKVKK